jgi:hypothetical protein
MAPAAAQLPSCRCRRAPRRLAVFYTPNGMMMDQFRPGAGASTLEPLNAFKAG